MDAIGKAIRTALAKGNAADPAHRERVYQSAQHALESALDKEGVTDPAMREARRQRLADAMAEIERDYLPAEERPAVAPEEPAKERAEPAFDLPESHVDMTASQQWTATVEPDKQQSPATGRREPSLDDPHSLASEPRSEAEIYPDPVRDGVAEREPVAGTRKSRGSRRKNRDRESDGRPRRKPFVWLLLISTLVVFGILGIGFWMISNADYEFVLEQFLQETEPGEDYTPEARLGGATDDRTQFVLYDAGDRSEPRTQGNLETSIVETGQAMALRVTGGGSEDDALIVPISETQLSELSGLPFTVAVRASSKAENGASLLVSCDFAGLGDCGNRRYQVEATAGDLLFAGTMGDGSPDGEGQIRIAVPDSGSEIDLLSVVLLVGDT
ncbi:hypothetical protein [Notoacmeibacter marinus]|uniref:hypothetical protein n=1 Tax=Notoacmeibacter marinus TaxID=1876515 RepID=UPI000DF497AE|nr:hypothetical protein [Notoacmeibacter marinus]